MQVLKSGQRNTPDFQALFRAVPGLYLAVSPSDLSIVAITDAFARAAMTSGREVAGRGLFEVLPESPGDPARVGASHLRSAIERVLATSAPDVMAAHRFEIRRPAAAGGGTEERQWIASCQPLMGDDGRVAFVIIGVEDITQASAMRDELASNLQAIRRARDILQQELVTDRGDIDGLAGELALRKRTVESAMSSAVAARDEAMRTSGLKTRFLAMISHELRTPLTALCLQVERMQRFVADLNDRHRESLERIAFSSTRLREMIETLLEYARVDAGRVAINPVSFDLHETVRRTLENHRHEAEQRGLTVTLSPPTLAALVLSDRRLVELVISNLVDNAIKFTNDGGVDVALTRGENGAYRVAVRDTGPGIPAEQQKKIFEPFEQLSAGGHHLSGIGLGLALVRDIAAALGGRIELDSREGQGSTFVFVVPSITAATPALSSSESAIG